MSRALVYRVYVHDEDGNVHGFGPGGDVPKWAAAKIKNPKAWGEESTDSAPAAEDTGSDAGAGSGEDKDKGGDTPPDPAAPYADLKAPDLKAEIKRRNEGRDDDDLIVPEGKKNTDLIAALVADDAAQADEE